ncbi:protein kinase domain-containing protein [Candidatus Marithrix sp. Canyon 246]|nr:protein kinase [Candidatus Marithrix sp. Canyon 246]
MTQKVNNWFIGLLVGLIILIITLIGLLEPLEQFVYDWSIELINHNPGDKVAVITIDGKSPADVARVINLVAPHSQVIATTLDFSTLQKPAGLVYIDELMTFYQNSKPLNLINEQLISQLSKVRGKYNSDRRRIRQIISKIAQLPEALTSLEDRLQAASIDLNGDKRLASSFKQTKNLVLSMEFSLGKSNVNLPDYIIKHAIKSVRTPFDRSFKVEQPPSISNYIAPLEILAENVLSIAYLNPINNNPHQFPLVLKHQDHYLPSLPLVLVANSLKSAIKVQLGKGVHLGKLQINTDANLFMRPFFYSNLMVDSYSDLLSGRVAAEKYKDKIVLLGDKASALVIANTVASILNQDFFIIPNWAIALQIILFLLILAYVCLLLPNIFVSGGAVLILFVLYVALLHQGLLVQLMPSILLIVCTYLVLQIKNAIVVYQNAFRLHPETIEENRLLGLAFQGQGNLDLAFEKFSLCPADETIMSLLYNLGLDYERKRNLKRAAGVYRYMIRQHPRFRDVKKRLERLHVVKKPRLLDSNFNELQLDDNGEKPVLGRYQIEKQLGKGAMGVVYLGTDTKLDRLMAIKTLPLALEFEEEELQEATIRFFREASAAGRLQHPNIVAIYDAGEEQDFAYIAMEFFKGGNLVPFTEKDNLLAIEIIIDIMISAADALHYAHSNEVIHRDIKPANIMYNPATEKIKLTDFGIAHITDSNKTKTGVILGTPSYMSPEQLAGKPINGSTDLFSLGVTLYQLLTGELPFQADSMATLMFKITNEAHPDILTIRKDIPLCLKKVIDISLHKTVSRRYQTGSEFANALRDCGKLGKICY